MMSLRETSSGALIRIGAKIFFVDEAHYRADADLREKWVLKGEAALVDSTSPRWGEKACYYSGVCLESGEVEAMEIAGNSMPRPPPPFYGSYEKTIRDLW